MEDILQLELLNNNNNNVILTSDRTYGYINLIVKDMFYYYGEILNYNITLEKETYALLLYHFFLLFAKFFRTIKIFNCF